MTPKPAATGILVSSCLVHATLIGGAFMCMPPLFDTIVKQEGWSLAALQRGWAFVPLGSGLVALATGALLQRRGDRVILALAGGLTVLAIAMRAWASAPAWFLASLFLFGLGSGAVLVTITSRVARSFDGERAGLAQAAYIGAYTIGAAAGLASSELMANAFGNWRTVSLVWAGICALSMIPALGHSMPASGLFGVAEQEAGFAHAYRNRVLRYGFVYAIYIGGYLGLVGLMPYQLREWGWPPVQADVAMSLSTLGFLVGAFFLAGLTDRRGGRRAVFAISMLAAGLLTLVAVACAQSGPHLGTWLAIPGIGFFGGAMALFFPIVLEDPRTGGERAPQAIGFTTAASYAGGFAVPFALAPYADAAPVFVIVLYAGAFACAGVAMVLGHKPSETLA